MIARMDTGRTGNDRLAVVAAGVGTLAWLLTGVLLVVLDGAGPDTSLAIGYPLFLFWLYPGSIAHALLLGYVVVRTVRGGGRHLLVVYPYLVVSLALLGTGALNYGAGELAAEAVETAERRLFDSEQVTLERTLLLRTDDAEAIRAALAAGADANRPVPPADLQPVLLAASRGAAETVGVLIDAGADPDAPSPVPWGGSRIGLAVARPLDLAALARDPARRHATVEALLRAGASPRESALLTIACLQGDAALYERAREVGAPDVADDDGRSCLHHAIIGDHRALFERHLSRSVDLDVAARHSGTPLDIALRRERWTMARRLLERGATATRTRAVRSVARRPAAGDEALVAVQALIAERWPGLLE
jgi:ankyrin repeat protein